MDKGVGPGLPALRRRGPQGQARRQVPRLDRRLLRDRLLDQPALDGRHQEPARAPDHPRRQAVRDQRRVVLQHPLPPRDEGGHADPRRPSPTTRRARACRPRRAGRIQHIVEAKGRDEVLAWAVERPDGGRGFGFTGAHSHKNWGDPNFRKLVLNAILWTAKLDVPPEGVESQRHRRGAQAEPRSQAPVIDSRRDRLAPGARCFIDPRREATLRPRAGPKGRDRLPSAGRGPWAIHGAS